MEIKKTLKFRLEAFFWDEETKSDINYVKILDLNCSRMGFSKFVGDNRDNGTTKILETKYGHHYLDHDFSNSHYITVGFGICQEITEEDFEILFLKWKALLTQAGLI